MMKLISLNVGIPRQVTFKSELVTTGIFKEPIHHRTILRKLNLDGDKQADLTVHGGLDKAVYSYPAEHYGFWQKELPGMYLSWGMFGENFTTEGLFENNVNIGDQFQIGSAIVIATQPRMPCYKLGVKFGRMDIIKRFLAGGLTGIYFKILQEGEVGAGDMIELIRRDDNNVTVKDVVRIYSVDKDDVETMERAIKVKDLPDGWRSHFIKQLDHSKK